MTTKCLAFFCFAFVLIAVCEAQGKKEVALNSPVSGMIGRAQHRESQTNPIGAEFLPEFVEYYNRGLDLIESENYLAAVEALKKAIQIDPSREEAYYALGSVYLVDLAKTTEAIEAFQIVIKLAPNNAPGHQMLGIAYFKRNEYQKATQALRRAIELEPKAQDNSYHPHYDLGLVYLKQNKFDAAIQFFEQAIQLNPDHISAYYSLGNAYIRGGNIKKGVEQIKKYEALKPYANRVSQLETALRKIPKNPAELWYQLGLVHLQYGKFEKALKPLEKSIELIPNNRAVYNTLAACYMRLNHFDKMQQACEAAIRLAPNEANTHNNLGMSYSLQGKYLEAMNSFLTAIRLDRENSKFHQNLGKVYERLGEAEKAAYAFRTARQLQAKPGNGENNRKIDGEGGSK